MDELRRPPEEFGVTGNMFYDHPKTAASYWLQFPPNEFLGAAVHDARNQLSRSVGTLQFLINCAEEGAISVEGQIGNVSFREYLETNLKALNELGNIIETVAQYANQLGTPSDQ